MVCKICREKSEFVFSAQILQKYNVKYFLCKNCNFLQAEDPYWLEEAYASPINITDTGILLRNLTLSKITTLIICFLFNRNAKFLDFAGEYGIFTRLMRDIGFDFYWYDKYSKNLLAQGFEYDPKMERVELITCFEAFEHFENPIKEFIKFYLYNTINLVVNPTKKIIPNTLLLLRLDAIGDYILFRNFIEVLKKGPKYKDYQITLVGNIAWRDIAENLDKNFINEFIWIDMRKFHKNFFYRYKKLKEITKRGYEVVIHPTYSRTLDADLIIKAISAKEKIGSLGDLSNITAWQKKITDSYYTKLLPAKKEVMFEFYRNKEFFENLFCEKISLKKPTVKLEQRKLNFNLPENYAILFIGASSSYRKWSISNFVEIGKFLIREYGYRIVLCGGPTDIEDANNFRQLADYDYVDLVGKTNLIDFAYVIYNGNLILTNETFSAHLAVALEMTNIFVISNGNHFGRFIPYPKEIWPYYYPIYHPEIEKDINNYKKLSNLYGHGSTLNINDITTAKVKDKIRSILRGK